MNGHDHTYERFSPQTPEGETDPRRGIREFVLGTGGGKGLYSFEDVKPNSEIRNSETYGVIRFELKADGYDWEFVPIDGAAFGDSGSGECY